MADTTQTRIGSLAERAVAQLVGQPALIRALVISQAAALVWWFIALQIRNADLVPVWYDQRQTFTQVIHHLADPYQTRNFLNPPWTALLLAPFGFMPLELATLIQTGLYFGILTGVIFKFGGTTRTVLAALTSFIAFVATLELNVDWLVCLGLLVPAAWSGPLILVKPQNALGYYLSVRRRELLWASGVTLAVAALSLLAWGWWPERMVANIRQSLLPRYYNLAPMAVLPAPVSIGIGLALGWYAFRRRDPALSVLAWLFFAPYLPFYSLLLPFALLALRFPRAGIIVSASLWAVYGLAVLPGLLRP